MDSIEQYIYDRITDDEALQELLLVGSDEFHLYPGVVPEGVEFEQAVTFTNIITTDVYPALESRNVQFNIFTRQHSKAVEICQALAAIFNEDNNRTEGNVSVVFSLRKSESDLGYDRDDGIYQREATYYFKMR